MKTMSLKLILCRLNKRYFNTSLIKSKIDTLENYAKKNQLHKLKMNDLFEVFKLAKTDEDYKLSLYLLNIYYNFGKNLNTQLDVNLFFIFMLRANQLHEAKDFLKYFNGWLLCPPSNKYIAICMEDFFSKKKYYDVREIFSTIRQNSQVKLESSFYNITIKSMLMLKDSPIEESMIIYDDSYNMSIYLPNETHNILLEHNLYYYHKALNGNKAENSKCLNFYEQNIHKIIVRLINELIKNRNSLQLSSKSLSLFAWTNIYFDLRKIIEKSNHVLMEIERCECWMDIFKLSCLYNQIPHYHCGPFLEGFKCALEEMKDNKDAIKALEYVNIYFN